MKKGENKNLPVSVIMQVLMVVLTGGTTCICSWFLNDNIYYVIRGGVMSVMGTLVVLYVFWLSAEKGKLDFQKENGVNFGRFVIVYLIGLVMALICQMLPISGWPYMIMFTALACFSNMACGITAGSVLLMISMLLTSGAGVEIFILYFMSGIVSVALFQNMDENFQAGVSVILSTLFLLVCETANIIMFTEKQINVEQFVVPAINLAVSVVGLFVLVKLYDFFVVNRYKNKYLELDDVEYMLLRRLKEKNPEAYYHSIHTARLSEHIAKKLQLDEILTKISSYYLQVGMILEENRWESVKKIFEIHKFPPAVMEILEECLNDSRPKRKETVIILFADEVVTTLQEIFKRDIDAEVDYTEIVDKIYHEKIVTGLLRENPITYTELQIMRKQFLEGKLYYDILR